jgi:hypothetical protein
MARAGTAIFFLVQIILPAMDFVMGTAVQSLDIHLVEVHQKYATVPSILYVEKLTIEN